MPRAPEELQQDKVLLRFLEEINDDVLRACEENDDSDAERFFTDWMLDFWTDTGLIEEGASVCNYDTRKFKVSGYKPSTDEDSIDLFVSHLVQQTEIQTLTKAQVNALFSRVRDFFEESAATSKRFFERMDGPPEAAAIAEDIFTRRRNIDRCGFSRQEAPDSQVKGPPFSVVGHHSRRLGHRPRLRRH